MMGRATVQKVSASCRSRHPELAPLAVVHASRPEALHCAARTEADLSCRHTVTGIGHAR